MAQPLPLPPHRARFPDPFGRFQTLPPEDQAWMRELVAALQRELDPRRTETRAQGQLLLIAPDGKAWAVKVAADGTLVTTAAATSGVLG